MTIQWFYEDFLIFLIPKIETRKPKRGAWPYSTHGVNIKIWKKYHFTLDFAQNVQ